MYGKIFASMFKGSLYGQWEAIVTFTVMIVLADQEGEVDMTHEALAAATSIPLEIIRKGIASLEAADPKSRTPDEEGRRIVRVSDSRDWGWLITNYTHYRAIRTAEERREYFKQHKRKQRARKKVTDSNASPPPSTTSPQSPPIAEAVSSKQRQEAINSPTHTARFAVDAHHDAYLRAYSAARSPQSFDAVVASLHDSPGTGPSYEWRVIGQAILELQSNGGAVTANALRAFCRKLTQPEPPARNGGATGKISAGRDALAEGLRKYGQP